MHEWVFPLEVWRRKHGQGGGEVNANTAVMEAEIANSDLHGLRVVETVGAPSVAHLRFART